VDVALFPKDPSESLLAALALAGIHPEPVDSLESVTQSRAAEWSILIVELGDEPMRRMRHLAGIAGDSGLPVLVVAESDHLDLMSQVAGVSDFLVTPVNPVELRLRLLRLQRASGSDELIIFKDLQLNPLTYQAHLDGAPLDLTFMEYELLRFLVERQGRVWTRDQLLSKVWGYDYFGGARTVDVHIRRLRAKLGEERASWITTVRSVGYRWG
jgi:DNA-binding response OmpR family regulator